MSQNNTTPAPLSAEEIEAKLRGWEESASVHGHFGPDLFTRRLVATLDAERARADALAAWQCASCGARFEKPGAPEELEGVAWCSTCAENQALRAKVAKLEEAARMISVDERWPEYDRSHRLYLCYHGGHAWSLLRYLGEDGGFENEENVTHWAPLLAAPVDEVTP